MSHNYNVSVMSSGMVIKKIPNITSTLTICRNDDITMTSSSIGDMRTLLGGGPHKMTSLLHIQDGADG